LAWRKKDFDRRNIPTVEATFRSRTVRDALDELSELTDVRIKIDKAVAKQVEGTAITMNLKGTDVDVALKKIADASKLGVVYREQDVYLTTAEKAKRMQAELEKADKKR
jgi:hypothetical protein